jgi:CRISPR-associated protein (TIGR02710 family)
MKTDNKIKKLMFITVGTGKDGSDIAHGIFFSIKSHNPDSCIFIGSTESINITLPHLKKLLDESGKNYNSEEIIVEEINDFEKLHNRYSDLIKSYLKKGYDKHNVVVDYTSGTKAMSAALVSAALTLEVGSISYVAGDRKEGRVQSGTERISHLSPTSIFSEKVLNQAVIFFNSYQFESAIELIRNYYFHPEYKKKAETLITLAQFFSAWDKFNFLESSDILKNLSEEQLNEVQLKGKFQKVFNPLLQKLKEEKLNYEKVDDLIFNSERRANEGKYDDAIARLYRALEMVGQIEFEKEFNCKTDDVNLNNLPETLRKDLEFKYKSYTNKKIQLPMYKTFDVLLMVTNPIAQIFESSNAEIKRHISKRNHSILAHGSIPVKKEHFKDFFDFLINKFSLGSNAQRFNQFNFPRISFK